MKDEIFTKTYQKIMRDKETTAIESLILCILYSMEETTKNGSYFTDEYLSNEINTPIRSIQRALSSLEGKGYIKRETIPDNKNGGKKRVIYILDKFIRIFDG